jgi:hypothetical protein
MAVPLPRVRRRSDGRLSLVNGCGPAPGQPRGQAVGRDGGDGQSDPPATVRRCPVHRRFWARSHASSLTTCGVPTRTLNATGGMLSTT